MYNHFITKQYKNAKEFQTAVEDPLHEQEILNSVFLFEIERNLHKTDVYCCALWTPDQELIFALFGVKDSFLFASAISKTIAEQDYAVIVDKLVEPCVTSGFAIGGAHAYEPTLSTLVLCLERHHMKLKLEDDVWSHRVTQVTWNERTNAIRNNPKSELRLMQERDIDLVEEYTQGFLDYFQFKLNEDCRTFCLRELANKHVYMLFIDGKPVSMSWKRRPMRKGCAIAYVFTPAEFRGRGYGATCVSLVTEECLKEYEYVTLFIMGTRDPENNMYTTIGYRLFSKAARYHIEQ